MSIVVERNPRMSRRPRSLREQATRLTVLVGGWLLIGVGAVFALLPGHVGVFPLVLGLIIVLRTSRAARRRFILLQRRHPKWVYPLRRLLRRKPEIIPVFWQQFLRMERLFLPRTWRCARRLRRGLFRRRP